MTRGNCTIPTVNKTDYSEYNSYLSSARYCKVFLNSARTRSGFLILGPWVRIPQGAPVPANGLIF
jgi:hypothetical protein